jgi:hydroxyacylglutathione hydrolase
VPEVDRRLEDGELVRLGALEARVLHTPGHSAGGCCFSFEDQRVVFVGDTLFEGSIGRTDLPGGSMKRLLGSIRERLFTLPDDTVVYPGHGNPTEIGIERKTNPFLAG